MAGGSADRGGDRARKTARHVMRRAVIAAALAACAVNVGIGLTIAREPERLADYVQVMEWSREWLRGLNPYAPPHSLADYPPAALVLLSPVAAIGDDVGATIWIAVNLAACGAIVLAARSPSSVLLLLLPAFRTLNQFTLPAFALGFGGFQLRETRPLVAGVLIGLALMKPHIGGPILLAVLFARRWKTAAAAAAVSLVLFGVFAAHARMSPAVVLRDHASAIARTQNRADLPAGETDFPGLVPDAGVLRVVRQAAFGAFLLVFVAGYATRRAHRPAQDERLLALSCLVSLLAFRHLGYNLVLAAPALLWCWRHHERRVQAAAWAAFAIFVLSPPTLWRYVLEPAGAPAALHMLLTHGYRAALLMLFFVCATTVTPRARRYNLRSVSISE